MSKVARIFASTVSTLLILAALLAPGAVAAASNTASPDAAPGWPLCLPWGETVSHCHTPKECVGSYVVIKYWIWYPYNWDHTEYTGLRCT
jgi:hypothetical protein